METSDLIKALRADAAPAGPSLRRAWWGAAALATLVAAAVFFVTLGPRPDFAEAARTLRFIFKFVVTLALAVTAFSLLRALSRPGGQARIALLLVAPVLLAVAGGLELAAVPSSDWAARMIGSNSLICLAYIPLIGLGPLAAFLLTLRYGAPTRPGLAGAVAGMLAGGIAATFYAAHCPDDSPLFVAIWYTLAIAGLTALGATLAPRLARW